MKKTLIFLVILAFWTLPLGAQTQEGSVAIAEKIRPEEEAVVLDNFSRCVAELKATGTKDKDARAACLKMASINADVTKRVANEAADATKASRPIFVSSRYGYGYNQMNQGSSRSRGGYDRARQQQRAEETRLRAERQAAASKALQQKRAEEFRLRQERLAAEAKAREEKRAADAAAREQKKKKEDK